MVSQQLPTRPNWVGPQEQHNLANQTLAAQTANRPLEQNYTIYFFQTFGMQSTHCLIVFTKIIILLWWKYNKKNLTRLIKISKYNINSVEIPWFVLQIDGVSMINMMPNCNFLVSILLANRKHWGPRRWNTILFPIQFLLGFQISFKWKTLETCGQQQSCLTSAVARNF